MARIESGKTELDESSISLKSLDSVYWLFESQMKEKNIDFTWNVNVKHNNVLCDVVKIKRYS